MSKLVWDAVGEHFYETGVDHGVLYLYNQTSKAYDNGVAWNGLTSVQESPSGAESNAQYGLDGLKHLADKIDYCLADSDFNKSDLRKAGFTCPIAVRPILIPFSDYEKKPDEKIIKK